MADTLIIDVYDGGDLVVRDDGTFVDEVVMYCTALRLHGIGADYRSAQEDLIAEILLYAEEYFGPDPRLRDDHTRRTHAPILRRARALGDDLPHLLGPYRVRADDGSDLDDE